MRLRVLSVLTLAAGALALAACDGKTPKPGFTQDSAPPPAAEAPQAGSDSFTPQGEADTQSLAQASPAAACCCCACAEPAACPPKAAAAPAAPAARTPARTAQARPPARAATSARAVQTAQRAHRPVRAQQGYQRYQGPDIATRAQGGYAHGHQGQVYAGGHAYAPPPQAYVPPPQAHVYVEPHGVHGGARGGYVEQHSYSEHSSGYAVGGAYAAGYGAGAPCCANRPQPAAGRDAGGYLTWPGKSAPAPYY